MNNSPLIIKNLTKCYGAQRVLDNVSIELNSGEIFGLIGLNGIGKTTLIKSVLGLCRSEADEVMLCGSPAGDELARHNIAYLPEKFYPSRHLSGYEYLALTLSYYGLALTKNLADQHARDLDLAVDKLSQRIASYSKGMAQKIGLIGAFLADRPLLILDEPMSGLDPVARIALKKKMLDYRDAGHSIFFSSHILADMDEICDRVGIIHDAKIRYLGTPAAFKETYPEGNLERAFLKAITVQAA